MRAKNVTTQQESTLNHTLAYIASLTGIPEKDIMSRSKVEHIVNARQIIAFLLIRKEKLSASVTGRLLQLDHSSILHSLKQIDYLVKINATVKDMVNNYILSKPYHLFINIYKIDEELKIDYAENYPEDYIELLQSIQNIVKQFQGLR